MATKREKSFVDGNVSASNFDHQQFNNLNLNQNHVYFEEIASSFCSDNLSAGNKSYKKHDFLSKNDFDSKSKDDSRLSDKYDKTLNPFSTEYLNVFESQKKQKQKDSSAINRSTLSLHIAAYENSVEAAATDDKKQLLLLSSESSTKKTANICGKTWKGVKQLFSNSSSSMGAFEIPRQQNEDKVSEPEIMHFKSSQKLLNPNEEKATLKTKDERKKDKEKNEFEKLKEEANKLFKAGKYEESANAYNQTILRCNNFMTNDQRAVIWSNRSAAYLLTKDEELILMAKFDAETTITICPSWWRGYFRLGRVQAVLEEWKEAEKSFEKALILNPESKEARDEMSTVRAKIGNLSRNENLDPSSLQLTKENHIKELAARFGISSDKLKEIEKSALDIPELGEAFRGDYYRDGIGGYKQDYKKAFECYSKAATYDCPSAMFNLGKLYKYGQGVKRDYKEAMKWLLKAASSKQIAIKGSGIAEAQHSIGLSYLEGVGVDKDYRKAAEWYEKAVQNDFAPSANNLGILYQNGYGVEKSAAKAFQYFKFAAEKGETPPMLNLANCYLNADGTGSIKPTDEDIAEGKKWLRKATEMGNIEAAQKLKECENLSSTDFLFESLRNLMMQDLFEKRDPLNYEEFGKYITEAAKNGSLTAQRHIKIWKNLDDAITAFKKKDSGGVVSALSKAIHLDHQIAKVPDFLKPVIEKRIKSHPNDLDTAVCFMRINTAYPNGPTLTDKYIQMFPDDEYLEEMVYSKYCVLQDSKNALKAATLALKKHPNSLRLLYVHAIALCQHEQSPECIKALDKFLAVAPKDNDKVPACFYRKAMYYNYRNDIPNFLASFEAGLAAEKEQLPCFLPYYFGAKTLMEKLFMIEKQKASKNLGNAILNSRLEKIKLDLSRKILLTKNRETFKFVAENIEKDMYQNSVVPPKSISQSSKNQTFTRIMLKDMDPTKDKIYNGFFLEGKIIDWAILMTGITNIIEDENGDVYRFAVYNWPLKTEGNQKLAVSKAIKDFYPNSKVSIMNPYMRLARDGMNVIRVESPEFIYIDKSSTSNKCHCCGKEEGKILSCSGCMMAKYCSKECQKHDWIEFNHKEICKHLKMFSTTMM